MKNAFVVDYENAEEIANAIEFIKENKEVAESLGRTAKNDALATYGLKTKVDSHIALYNNLLDYSTQLIPAVLH